MFGPAVDAWVTGVISASTNDNNGKGRYADAFKPSDVMRQAQQALYEMSDSLTGIEDLVTRLIHATRDPKYKPSRSDRERRTGKAYKLHPDGSVAREKIRETCENFYIVQKQRAAQLRTYEKLDARIRKTQARPKGPITTGGKDGPNEIIRALLSPEMIRKVRSFADSVGIGAGSTQAQKDAMMEDAQFASLRNIAEANAQAQKRHSFGNTDAYGNSIPTDSDDDGDDENRYTEATGGQGSQGGGSGASKDAWNPPPMLYTEEPAAAPYNGAAPFQRQYPPQFQQQQFHQNQFPPQQFQYPPQQQFPPPQFQQQQQFQQLPQQQFQQLPYANQNQGPGYYDQGQYNGGQGQGPLTFTQKLAKLINDVMDSQIGRFVCAALATLVVYLIVCAFLQWLDNGAWIFCRLYDHIVGNILGLTTWKHQISNEQRAEIAIESFKKSNLYKQLEGTDNAQNALDKLRSGFKSKEVTVKDNTITYKRVGLSDDADTAPQIEFFKEFYIKDATNASVAPNMDDVLKSSLSAEETAKILNTNDAIKFVGVPSGLQSFAEDTNAMVLLYTSLVTSTFLGFVGARKRFFVIPAASVAASIWLRGSRTVAGVAEVDTGMFKSARGKLKDFTNELQPTEVAILVIGLKVALGFIGMVVAGGSAREAASKATFAMTHELQGDLERRQASRRMHDESVARLSAHPVATMLKTGAEFLGYNNIGY